jgi:hypothetical protein
VEGLVALQKKYESNVRENLSFYYYRRVCSVKELGQVMAKLSELGEKKMKVFLHNQLNFYVKGLGLLEHKFFKSSTLDSFIGTVEDLRARLESAITNTEPA